MKRAIIIPTTEKYKEWLTNCLSTINTDIPILIVYNPEHNSEYEMLAIKTGIELQIDEFFVLQDTTEIKDNSIWDILFNKYKGRTVFFNTKGQSYLNKYRYDVLRRIGVQKISSKIEAVYYEDEYHKLIKSIEEPIILFPNFIDNDKREYLFGRNNMIIENKYLKKYKGCWHPKMIK